MKGVKKVDLINKDITTQHFQEIYQTYVQRIVFILNFYKRR